MGRVEILEHGEPSLKLEMIGFDDLAEGFAIKPRIAASCFIWVGDPARRNATSCRWS